MIKPKEQNETKENGELLIVENEAEVIRLMCPRRIGSLLISRG